MDRIKTKIDFYFNTPLTDFFNTIHFKDDLERDTFFTNCIWKRFSSDFEYNVNLTKGELLIKSEIKKYKDLKGLNYCRIIDNNENKYYYYFIVKTEIINQNTTKLYLVIDVLMTYTQGKKINNLKCLNIEREHLDRKDYFEMLPYLQKNSDTLQTFTKKYSFETGLYFDDYAVLILSSCSLEGGFGDVNNPQIKGTGGGKLDKINSPLAIYMVNEVDFTKFMEALSKYPWVQQHIQKMILMPKMFLSDNLFTLQKTDYFDKLYTFYTGSNITKTPELEKKLNDFNISFDELIKMLDIDLNNLHLLRNEYISVELYNYNGNNVKIDVSDISQKYGLTFDTASVIGYENIVSFYLKELKVSRKRLKTDITENTNTIKFRGQSLNNAITFSDFDNVPMAINVKDLSLSKNAHQRALQESRLFSNRLNNVLNGTDTQSRLYDAISLTSNISIANLFGRLNDEYNYYKDLKAQSEDKAIEPPTITQSSNTNALTRNNNIYGITLKIATLDTFEFNKIKKYYKLLGYQVDKQVESVSDIECMTNVNYLKCNGSFNFKNIDTAHNEILKQVFANGVRFWHYTEDDGNDFVFSNKKIEENEWRV